MTHQFDLSFEKDGEKGAGKKERPKIKKEHQKHGIFEMHIRHTEKEHLCARCEAVIPAKSQAIRLTEFKNGKFAKEEYFHPKGACSKTIREILKDDPNL